MVEAPDPGPVVAALGAMAWMEEAPGIHSRSTVLNGVRWAVVRYAPSAERDEWCTDGHRGYVLHGHISYELKGGDRLDVPAAGRSGCRRARRTAARTATPRRDSSSSACRTLARRPARSDGTAYGREPGDTRRRRSTGSSGPELGCRLHQVATSEPDATHASPVSSTASRKRQTRSIRPGVPATSGCS